MFDSKEMAIDQLMSDLRSGRLDIAKITQAYKLKLVEAKIEVEKYEQMLTFLQNAAGKPINLKWRDEIRHCLATRDVASSAVIAECISIRNNVEADKNIKAKVASTLSLMFNEGLLGRIQLNGERDFKYGDTKHFKQGSNGKYTEMKD